MIRIISWNLVTINHQTCRGANWRSQVLEASDVEKKIKASSLFTLYQLVAIYLSMYQPVHTHVASFRRRRGWQRLRWLDGITDSMDMSLSNLQEFGDGQGSLVCCSPWGHKELNTTEQLNLAEKVLEALSLISLRGSRNHLKSQPFFLLHRVLILGDEKSFCRNV